MQTRFQTVMEDLKNTGYGSYWTKELGKRKDILPLPFSIKDPHTITFGKPPEKEGKLYIRILIV